MSIDEMIKAGKTLPEIQAELRKAVAARDESMLKAERDKKITIARTNMINAMVIYYDALGVPVERDDLEQTLDKCLCEYEQEILPCLKVLEKVPKSPKSRSTLDEVSLEKALAQLRAFSDSL